MTDQVAAGRTENTYGYSPAFPDARVYFIKPVGMKGPIKIGCSITPQGRLEQLAAWSPFPLELIGSVPGSLFDERFLHDCFSTSHTHREWFKPTPRLARAIKTILAAGTVDAVRGSLKRLGPVQTKRDTPEWRERMSYVHRISWAERKVGRIPSDIKTAMRDWRDAQQKPAPELLARLDAFLARAA